MGREWASREGTGGRNFDCLMVWKINIKRLTSNFDLITHSTDLRSAVNTLKSSGKTFSEREKNVTKNADVVFYVFQGKVFH